MVGFALGLLGFRDAVGMDTVSEKVMYGYKPPVVGLRGSARLEEDNWVADLKDPELRVVEMGSPLDKPGGVGCSLADRYSNAEA